MNKKQFQDFLRNNATMLIVFVSLLFFLAIALIVYFGKLRGNDAGTIGDAFNGLVGPFIGLLSAILVYRSFVAQTEANERQTEATIDQIKTNKAIQSQWMYETYFSLFNDIKNSYKNIKAIERPGGAIEVHYSGEDAIMKYTTPANILKEDKEKLEKDLESVLRVMNYFFQKLTVIEIQEKDFVVYMVIEFYQTYMQEALMRFRAKAEKDGREMELAETIILINSSITYYGDLLKLMETKD